MLLVVLVVGVFAAAAAAVVAAPRSPAGAMEEAMEKLVKVGTPCVID